jgi:2-oxoglutarate ferredoxin oxidoreductase subunit alpha
MQARWGTHGDHPIIALSPSSVREAFDLTVKAFNFAELYRTPVLLMMDEVVGHMREKVDLPDQVEAVDRLRTDVPPEWYYPYEDGGADVPPLVPFGRGFRYHITGLFHDRAGFPTERLDEIDPWLKRVSAKIERNLDDILLYWQDGVQGARTLVIAYGSTSRSARHAVAMARARRHKVGFINLLTIWPFPVDMIAEAAQGVRTVVVPEMNLGQVALEVERVVGRHKVRRVNRADGQLIAPGEILAAIEEH